jgi:hypothetical protein
MWLDKNYDCESHNKLRNVFLMSVNFMDTLFQQICTHPKSFVHKGLKPHQNCNTKHYLCKMLSNMMLQIVIAAKNNIIAISLFKRKTITVTWNDTGWGTKLGSGNSTSAYSTLFTSSVILTGMPYSSGSQSVGRAPRGGGARGAKLFYSLKINKKHKYN